VARRFALVAACLTMLAGSWAAGADSGAVRLEVKVDAERATVGDPITVELRVDLGEGARLEPERLGPELGPFSVVEESWSGPEEVEGARRWLWKGTVVAFRTGELELPAIRVRVLSAEGATLAAESEPQAVSIESVLDPAETEDSLADLKPPVGVPADYATLFAAGGIILVLLLVSLLVWWIHRRYGARLAAVAPVEDPFHRTPPDVWIYAELQKLLDRRLAEQGEVEEFFAELSRILKFYLSGRFRVELLERTTDELPGQLRQSGAPDAWIETIHELLVGCDMVKFARARPVVEDCREAIERTYRIVDATKPQVAAGAA